ncbi:hypothetical protein C9E81_15910 [Paracoccus alkanivorans]|uniref:Uncharacterized protein n=1 Tax=Paracoccus alkanivorans TaxID=2116655 RepID=A0A3M0M971_9RHOB|nr:hypothetical protein C9E81_15910 [Paracoccus alkanivorans]
MDGDAAEARPESVRCRHDSGCGLGMSYVIRHSCFGPVPADGLSVPEGALPVLPVRAVGCGKSLMMRFSNHIFWIP